jgi:hypothetical protein
MQYKRKRRILTCFLTVTLLLNTFLVTARFDNSKINNNLNMQLLGEEITHSLYALHKKLPNSNNSKCLVFGRLTATGFGFGHPLLENIAEWIEGHSFGPIVTMILEFIVQRAWEILLRISWERQAQVICGFQMVNSLWNLTYNYTANGWVKSFGSQGRVAWNGSLFGQLAASTIQILDWKITIYFAMTGFRGGQITFQKYPTFLAGTTFFIGYADQIALDNW